jgi:hypothetical protein
MSSLLIRLMVLASLTQLGISLSTFHDCRSRACLLRIEKASREVLRVDWKPVSMFPSAGRKFR